MNSVTNESKDLEEEEGAISEGHNETLCVGTKSLISSPVNHMEVSEKEENYPDDLHGDIRYQDLALDNLWSKAVRKYQEIMEPNRTSAKTTYNRKRRRKAKNNQNNLDRIVMREEELFSQNDNIRQDTRKERPHVTLEKKQNKSSKCNEKIDPKYYLQDDSCDKSTKKDDQPEYPPNAQETCTDNNVIPQFAVLPQDNDLANLLMAWYWAGYYSAIYQNKQAFYKQ